jgi:hypothetical protein
MKGFQGFVLVGDCMDISMLLNELSYSFIAIQVLFYRPFILSVYTNVLYLYVYFWRPFIFSLHIIVFVLVCLYGRLYVAYIHYVVKTQPQDNTLSIASNDIHDGFCSYWSQDTLTPNPVDSVHRSLYLALYFGRSTHITKKMEAQACGAIGCIFDCGEVRRYGFYLHSWGPKGKWGFFSLCLSKQSKVIFFMSIFTNTV